MNYREIHDHAVVIDAACPLANDPTYLDWYKQGGLTAIAPTVGGWDDARTTLANLAKWSKLITQRSDVLLARTASDISTAKSSGKLGLFHHFQGTDPIEGDLNLVYLYKDLGVGLVQLTYNRKNRVGDGCEERTDSGLSRFGVDLIKTLNDARVIVDVSHTGLRTSMEAIEFSKSPVIVSHGNPRGVHPSPRNLPDELIRSIAACGGVIGTVGFPAFVGDAAIPTLEQMIRHIDYVVELVGIDHVSLGIDYYRAQAGVMSDENAIALYEATIASGRWTLDSYPRPPHIYPAGIETPRTMFRLTEGLVNRGYSALDVRKILGANLLRVMGQVWG